MFIFMIYINQRGAGCGKTYESIQLLRAGGRFAEKRLFVYLTKMHSAKHVMNTEHESQLKRLEIVSEDLVALVQSQNTAKHYVYQYPDGKLAVFATVDSFMFALGDKGVQKKPCGNVFKELAKSIANGHRQYDSGLQFWFAGQMLSLGYDCLVVVDEAQDLTTLEFGNAFRRLAADTGTDFYMVGDKLQSIWGSDNVFVRLYEDENITKDTGLNVVKRFHNFAQAHMVNDIVPFSEFALPEITGICAGAECGHPHHEQQTVLMSLHRGQEHQNAEEILKHVRAEVELHGYLPRNFMFIFPFISNNKLAQCLQRALNEFWQLRLGALTDGQERNYAVLHKSETSQPIDLTISEDSCRLLSIHAAKGQGREVVFVVGLSHSGICHQAQQDKLKYWSLVHVAVTRQKRRLFIAVEREDLLTAKIAASQHVVRDESQREPERRTWTTVTELVKTISNDSELVERLLRNSYQGVLGQLTGSESAKTVEWGDHITRYSAFRYLMLKKLSANGCGQAYGILNSAKGVRCVQVERKDYEAMLNRKKNLRKEKHYNELNTDVAFPVILYPTQRDRALAEVFLVVAERAVRNVETKANCILELCALPHIIDIMGGKDPQITVDQMYDLIELFSVRQQDDGVCEVCRAKIDSASTAHRSNDSKHKHFSKAFGQLQTTVNSLFDQTAWMEGLKWSVDKFVSHKVKAMDVSYRYPFFGCSGKRAVVVYVKPSLSTLNLAEFLVEAELAAWHLRGNSEFEEVRVAVVTCVSKNPIWVDVPQETNDDLRVAISNTILSQRQIVDQMFREHQLSIGDRQKELGWLKELGDKGLSELKKEAKDQQKRKHSCRDAFQRAYEADVNDCLEDWL